MLCAAMLPQPEEERVNRGREHGAPRPERVPIRRYFLNGREVARRDALNEWIRQSVADGASASYARRVFDAAEELQPRAIGEVAQAQRELDAKGVVVTGAEGL